MTAAVTISIEAATGLRSFEGVLAAEERRVLALALRLTGNLADAQDVAQEAFLRLHRNWQALSAEPEQVLHAWLRRVTLNLVLDEGRRKSRRKLVAIDESVAAVGRTVEQTAMERERSDQLTAALARLSDRERSALVLRELEGLSTAEVAAELGIAEPTVRVHIAKARLKLRELLKGGEAL